MFGLRYLQQINDHPTGGALHLEPGLWITQPATSYPPETSPAGTQIIARMGTIPHGNRLLAEGIAEAFEGPPPVLPQARRLTRSPDFRRSTALPFRFRRRPARQ